MGSEGCGEAGCLMCLYLTWLGQVFVFLMSSARRAWSVVVFAVMASKALEMVAAWCLLLKCTAEAPSIF